MNYITMQNANGIFNKFVKVKFIYLYENSASPKSGLCKFSIRSNCWAPCTLMAPRTTI